MASAHGSQAVVAQASGISCLPVRHGQQYRQVRAVAQRAGLVANGQRGAHRARRWHAWDADGPAEWTEWGESGGKEVWRRRRAGEKCFVCRGGVFWWGGGGTAGQLVA